MHPLHRYPYRRQPPPIGEGSTFWFSFAARRIDDDAGGRGTCGVKGVEEGLHAERGRGSTTSVGGGGGDSIDIMEASLPRMDAVSASISYVR